MHVCPCNLGAPVFNTNIFTSRWSFGISMFTVPLSHVVRAAGHYLPPQRHSDHSNSLGTEPCLIKIVISNRQGLPSRDSNNGPRRHCRRNLIRWPVSQVHLKSGIKVWLDCGKLMKSTGCLTESKSVCVPVLMSHSMKTCGTVESNSTPS